MTYFDTYIYIIFAVKICFILMAITHIYLKATGKSNSKLNKTIFYWKERFEFIFIVLMSILLVYLFNPRYQNQVLINRETKLLLYLFGFILLITAKWDIFIEEAPWFKKFQSVIGNRQQSR